MGLCEDGRGLLQMDLLCATCGLSRVGNEDSLTKTDMLDAKINFGASKIRVKGLTWSNVAQSSNGQARSARRALCSGSDTAQKRRGALRCIKIYVLTFGRHD